MKKKTYRVEAEITISLNACVRARSKEEAIMIAENLSLPDIHETDADEEKRWSTSGMLDGEPLNLSATEDDEDEESEEEDDEDAEEEEDDDEDEPSAPASEESAAED